METNKILQKLDVMDKKLDNLLIGRGMKTSPELNKAVLDALKKYGRLEKSHITKIVGCMDTKALALMKTFGNLDKNVLYVQGKGQRKSALIWLENDPLKQKIKNLLEILKPASHKRKEFIAELLEVKEDELFAIVNEANRLMGSEFAWRDGGSVYRLR